jgi:hypothetical protein
MKLRDWDSIGRTYQERIKGLENENMILKDKNEILQVGFQYPILIQNAMHAYINKPSYISREK